MISSEIIEAIFRSIECAGTDATRYHLSQVHLRKTSVGWEVAATNGHMLVVHSFTFDCANLKHERYNFAPEWIEFAKAIRKNLSSLKTCRVVEIEGKEYISIEEFKLPLEADNNKIYPNYSEVYPATKIINKFAVNPEYLYKVSRALSQSSRHPIIEIYLREGTSALEIRMNGIEGKAYVMPCRMSGS